MEESPRFDTPAGSGVGTLDGYEEGVSPWRTLLKVVLAFSVAVVLLAGGALYYVQGTLSGSWNPSGLRSTIATLIDPREAFPGQSRLTVLCLGLDRNIMISRDPKLNQMPYTKGARSDVMMVAGLDLVDQSVSVLSVPRDTRIILPGRESYSKINEAHARGGIPYTRQTVEEFLSVPVDHHVVIKQEAIEAIIDALGGLKLNVEKDMDYDDNWGQLHIHLKEGEQVLDGKQVVGYMRFRHDLEGDFGRIRRQQQVIQTLAGAVKSPTMILKADGLLKAIAKYVQTDLTFDQQLALAHLFHKIQPGNVQTVQMPVVDDPVKGKISYVIPDEERLESAVDWVIRGNREAMNRLVRVELKNASGEPELYQQTYRALRSSGFQVIRAGRMSGEPVAATRAVQHGRMRGAARRVLEVLGLSRDVERDEEKSRVDVTLIVGQDLRGNAILAMAEDWEEPPAPVRRRSRRASLEGAAVTIRPAATEPEPEVEEAPAEPDQPVDEPSSDPVAPPADEDKPAGE